MGFFNTLNERVKRMDFWDIGLIKWTVLFFTLALITTIPPLMDFVHSVNIWWFWSLAVLCMIRPLIRFFKKV